MYICTCNKCANVWIDTNPDPIEYHTGPEADGKSIFYPDDLELRELCLIEDMKTCCVCKTDAYLVNNLNENAGGMARELFELFDAAGKVGHDIDEFIWAGIPLKYRE